MSIRNFVWNKDGMSIAVLFLGCLAVVTYEFHHVSIFFKCYPDIRSYKFDMCNGYKDDILIIDALF